MSTEVEDTPASPRHVKKQRSFVKELPFLVVAAFVIALVIKQFLVQAFYIPSGSMENTLQVQDRVLVNKLVYDVRDIRRGEVVVFDGAGTFTPDPGAVTLVEPTNPVQRVAQRLGRLLGTGAPGEQDFIKRVIGVPGDRVACCTPDGDVTVQPEGGEPVALDETYVFEDDRQPFCEAGQTAAACPTGAAGVLVPEGRLWVMGDHRCCSSDSRRHGTIPEGEVIGRAFVVVWPFDRLDVLQVPAPFGDGALALSPAAATATPYALGALVALPVAGLRRRRRR